MRPTRTWTTLGVAIALVAGCSSPPDQPADASNSVDAGTEGAVVHAPIDATRMIGTLTDSEWAEICDWEAERLGGYGHRPSCDSNFTPMAPPDQATCVGLVRITWPCDLTVADFERCIGERVDDPCALDFPTCEPIGICHDPPDARPDGH